MELETVTEEDYWLSREPSGRQLDVCTSSKCANRTGDGSNDIDSAYTPIIICEIGHRFHRKSVSLGALDYRLGAVTPHRRVNKVFRSLNALITAKTQSIAMLRAGKNVPASRVSFGPAEVPVTGTTPVAGTMWRSIKRVSQAISCPKLHILHKEEFYG